MDWLSTLSPAQASGFGALILATAHATSRLMRTMDRLPRARLLSFAGGITVAFVLLRLLPVLGDGQQAVDRVVAGTWLAALDRHLYLIALVGVLVFFGLEQLSKLSRLRRRFETGSDRSSPAAFAVAILGFCGMQFLVGRLLLDQAEPGGVALGLYIVAMGLKVLVDDHGLYQDHKSLHLMLGRWLLAAAVLGGWASALWLPLPAVVPPLIQSFLIGSVLFSVLKEELPAEKDGRFGAFAGGAVTYAVLLIML